MWRGGGIIFQREELNVYQVTERIRECYTAVSSLGFEAGNSHKWEKARYYGG